MKIGFTGTREGMSEAQRRTVYDLLLRLPVTEAHHGDCVGADAQFHDVLLGGFGLSNVPIILHPPDVPTLRAFSLCVNEVRAPKPFLDRNRDIVDECDLLIAAPRHDAEEMRSGTWATVRYARQTGKPIRIVYADGEVEAEDVAPFVLLGAGAGRDEE